MRRTEIIKLSAILAFMAVGILACLGVSKASGVKKELTRLEAEYETIDPSIKRQWASKSAEVRVNLNDARKAMDHHDRVAAKLHLEIAKNNLDELISTVKPPAITGIVDEEFSPLPPLEPEYSLVPEPVSTDELAMPVVELEASTAEERLTKIPPPDMPATKVLDVFAIREEDELRGYIIADGIIGDYTVLEVSNPPRLVIDLPGLKKGYWESYVKVKGKFVKAIRLGAHSEKVRVVFDSNSSNFLDYTIVRDADRLKIIITGYMSDDYWPSGIPKPSDEPEIVVPPDSLTVE